MTSRVIGKISFEGVPPDGNCFYHAVAKALNERDKSAAPITVQYLRQMIVDYVLANPDKINDFLQTGPFPGDLTFTFLSELKETHPDQNDQLFTAAIKKYFTEPNKATIPPRYRDAEQFEVSIITIVLSEAERPLTLIVTDGGDITRILMQITTATRNFPVVVVDVSSSHYNLVRFAGQAIGNRNIVAAEVLTVLLDAIETQIYTVCPTRLEFSFIRRIYRSKEVAFNSDIPVAEIQHQCAEYGIRLTDTGNETYIASRDTKYVDILTKVDEWLASDFSASPFAGMTKDNTVPRYKNLLFYDQHESIAQIIKTAELIDTDEQPYTDFFKKLLQQNNVERVLLYPTDKSDQHQIHKRFMDIGLTNVPVWDPITILATIIFRAMHDLSDEIEIFMSGHGCPTDAGDRSKQIVPENTAVRMGHPGLSTFSSSDQYTDYLACTQVTGFRHSIIDSETVTKPKVKDQLTTYPSRYTFIDVKLKVDSIIICNSSLIGKTSVQVWATIYMWNLLTSSVDKKFLFASEWLKRARSRLSGNVTVAFAGCQPFKSLEPGNVAPEITRFVVYMLHYDLHLRNAINITFADELKTEARKFEFSTELAKQILFKIKPQIFSAYEINATELDVYLETCMDAGPTTNNLEYLLEFLMNVVFVYYMHKHILTQPGTLNDTITNKVNENKSLCVVIKEHVTDYADKNKSLGETLNYLLDVKNHPQQLAIDEREFTLFRLYIEMLHRLQPGLKFFIRKAKEFAFLQDWETKFVNK